MSQKALNDSFNRRELKKSSNLVLIGRERILGRLVFRSLTFLIVDWDFCLNWSSLDDSYEDAVIINLLNETGNFGIYWRNYARIFSAKFWRRKLMVAVSRVSLKIERQIGRVYFSLARIDSG